MSLYNKHPSLSDFREHGHPLFYLDKSGRAWWALCVTDKPTITLQRVGCRVHPMDMPRQSVVEGSPWSHDWTLTSPDDPRVRRALVNGRP